jgi:peptidyl-prolyl cis-trans isomerase B (cyclophilin B)
MKSGARNRVRAKVSGIEKGDVMSLIKFALVSSMAILVVASAVIAGDHPKVVMDTTQGRIVFELDADKAPQTVQNFLAYVEAGFYDGTIFHRVIPGFMIQGGGFSADMNKKRTRPPINNEADNGLRNERGTIAMARTSDPHSATAQFFINTVDNDFLNYKSKNSGGWGYAVFGRVAEGMAVVDVISGVNTGTRGHMRDVPNDPVVIIRAVRLK